jgi:hypothetical protein
MYGAQIPRKSTEGEDNIGNSADIDGILRRGSDACRIPDLVVIAVSATTRRVERRMNTS